MLSSSIRKNFFISASGIIALLAVLLLSASIVSAQASKINPEETVFKDLISGKHYDFTKKESKFNNLNKIEVVEVFAYSCPHCATMERKLPQWLRTLPDEVKFIKVPVQWSPIFHATLYWSLTSLRKEARVGPSVFKAIASGTSLRSFRGSEAFLKQFGIPHAVFAKHMNSFYVKNVMRKTRGLISDWGVRSTPGFVVNGKYVVPGSNSRGLSHDDILNIVEVIIAAEQEEL